MVSLKYFRLGFCGLLLLGSFGAGVFGYEWFPFSNYPMYSSSFNPEIFSYYELVGIDSNDSEVKIPIRIYFYPLFKQSLYQSIDRNLRVKKDPSALIKSLYLFQLDSTQKMNLSNPLKGLRLYSVKYNWEKFKADKLSSHTKENPLPQRRDLIVEYYDTH